MSVLQTLRDRAGVLLAVVIGVSLIFFILGDFLGGGSGGNRKARKYYEIAEIDGETISYQEFDLRVQNLIEIYKLSGTTTITEALSETVRSQIWDQFVREKVLGDEFEVLGLGVGAEEVDNMVLGDEPHPIVLNLFANRETGIMDKSFMVNFLKTTEYDPQAKAYWLFFEDEIVTDKLNSKFNTLVAKGLYITSKQVEYENSITANTVDFSFVVKNLASVPDSSVTVTDNDLESYYDSNREQFQQTASRDMEYVEFEVLASSEDIRKTEEWINNNIEDFKSDEDPKQFINLNADNRHIELFKKIDDIPEILHEFISQEDLEIVYGPYEENETYKLARLIDFAQRPDSVHARHILISPNAYRTMETAKSEADSLLSVIQNGAPFETVAMVSSDDQGSAQLGGDLGWFIEGQMVIPFNNACFEGKKGDLTIVETDFGYHLIEILDQVGMSKKYHVGIVDRLIEPSSQTFQKIYSEASRFAGMNNTYEKFNQAIADSNLSKKVATDLGPEEKIIAGLETPRSLVMSLFEVEKEGIILDRSQQAVFELGNKFVIAYCTDIKEEGYASLEEVENDVRYAVLREKKADKLISDMNESTQGMDNIDDISSALGLAVQEATNISFSSISLPSSGIEPAIIATASGAEEGFLSKPLKGNNGIFIISVNTVTPVEQAQDIELLKIMLSSNFEIRASFEAFEALKNEMIIVDKRYKFY